MAYQYYNYEGNRMKWNKLGNVSKLENLVSVSISLERPYTALEWIKRLRQLERYYKNHAPRWSFTSKKIFLENIDFHLEKDKNGKDILSKKGLETYTSYIGVWISEREIKIDWAENNSRWYNKRKVYYGKTLHQIKDSFNAPSKLRFKVYDSFK